MKKSPELSYTLALSVVSIDISPMDRACFFFFWPWLWLWLSLTLTPFLLSLSIPQAAEMRVDPFACAVCRVPFALALAFTWPLSKPASRLSIPAR